MGATKTILFVEDSENLQRIMKNWLKGYELKTFDNADDAYECAASLADKGRPADLFLLDIMLKQAHSPPQRRRWAYHREPIAQGVQLGQEIREIKEYRDTPMIFLSAKLQRESDRETLGRKVQAICFQKPVPYKELHGTIADILGRPEKSYWRKLATWVGAD